MDRPNIVFIMADDMGYGDLGCYGATKIPTPHIDRLADDGMLFTDAHAPSAVCTPSRYGVLTGRYCWRGRRKRGVAGSFSLPHIDPARMTVASLLKAHGYVTGAVGKWHVGLEWALQEDYVRVRQVNDQWAWSSPIWIGEG
jgi:arylsulfatase A-like enzyme